MGFNFRYEALLSYRQHMKEKAEIELSMAQRQLRQCREILEDHKESIRRTNQDLKVSLKAKIASHTLKNHSEYMAALDDKIAAQVVEITKSEQIVRERLNTLLTKTKQYKVIERLKEKDLIKWNHHQHHMEQKEISEISIIRHGRDFL